MKQKSTAYSIERKQAQEEFYESKERLSLLFDTVSDCICLVKVEPDNRNRILAVNKALLNETGFTDEQIIGKTVDEVIPKEEVEFVERKCKAKSLIQAFYLQ
ncbi:PAS domain S-box protein [candidate division KSB1 bacterium]|nr:PAS domain S-box protein [candidate division KSB1 bacterium]